MKVLKARAHMQVTKDLEEMKKQLEEFRKFVEFIQEIGITNELLAKLSFEKMRRDSGAEIKDPIDLRKKGEEG